MPSVMNAERLVAEARRNRTGTASPDLLEPQNIGPALHLALSHLLNGIAYEGCIRGDGAISARMIASLIVCAEEIAEIERRH